MDWINELREYVAQYSTAPDFDAMPRRTLKDKGIDGPTGAHCIEQLHTPLNFDFITVTTGTTAFQNIVGVTAAEIEDRIAASTKALRMCGLNSGDEMLVTYPPLINVFPKKALDVCGIKWSFLEVSSRDALLLAMLERRPHAVLGESSFLRAALKTAKELGMLSELPRGMIFIAAGTPLDLELLLCAQDIGASVHDIYGCQEFGWIALDGVALRKDVRLIPSNADGLFDLVVGGLSTGDRFPVLDSGHICNHDGKIITYARERTAPDMETTIRQTTAHSLDTVERLARTILRIKAKIVRTPKDCIVGAEHTVLSVSAYGGSQAEIITGPDETRLFDTLLDAQIKYQSMLKNDPTWHKER